MTRDAFEANRAANWRDSLDARGRPTHGPAHVINGCDHCDGPLEPKAGVGQYECPWCVAMYTEREGRQP